MGRWAALVDGRGDLRPCRAGIARSRRATMPAETSDATNRTDQPEGRGGKDHHRGEPRSGPGGARAARRRVRSRSPGEHDPAPGSPSRPRGSVQLRALARTQWGGGSSARHHDRGPARSLHDDRSLRRGVGARFELRARDDPARRRRGMVHRGAEGRRRRAGGLSPVRLPPQPRAPGNQRARRGERGVSWRCRPSSSRYRA